MYFKVGFAVKGLATDHAFIDVSGLLTKIYYWFFILGSYYLLLYALIQRAYLSQLCC